MKARYYLSALAFGLCVAHADAQAPKPQPESPGKPGPIFRTHHQDNPDFRGGGDGGDECANATVLVVGSSCTTIAGSALGATQSQAPILCNGFTSGAALDVWFQFTATAASTTVTATGAGDFDVVMEVFSGACGSLVSLGCADATFPPGGLVETFVAATTAGQTYRVRIYSYTPPANTSTSFTICAFSPGGGGAPANDNCGGAVVQNLSVPGSISLTGNNTGATVDAPTDFVLVWHAFTIANCANVNLNYCVTGSVFEDFLVNLVVNCPDFLTGFLTGTVSPDNCTLSFTNLAAGTYYVPVLVDATLTPVGGYTVNVTATACGGGNPPANDPCASATTIGVNATCVATAGTTEGATQSLAPAACSGFTSAAANDVWYTFTATAASTTISVTGLGDATTGMDPVLEAFSGTCAALTSLGCVDATLRGGTETLTIATTPGTTYLYRIYYWDYGTPQAVFGFNTCVTAAGGGSAPANDLCANATTIGVNATCVATPGTTQGATQSLAPAACSGFTAASASDVWYSFSAIGTSTTIQVTGDGDATTGMDPVLEAFSGTCAALTSLGCIDATLRGGTETLVINTTPGTTYLYRIYYWDYGTPQAVFGFNTCVFGSGVGPTPPNDLCGNVIPVNLANGSSVDFSGNNLNATSTGDFGPDYPFTPQPTVWHAFTTTECSNVTVSYCATDPDFGVAYIFLAADCPANAELVTGTFSFTDCPDNIVIFYNDLPAGTWYLPVLLDPANNAAGDYDITVSAVACSYCGASAENVNPAGEKISNVTFTDINNSSTSPNGYEDFTSVVGSVVAGVNYPISITLSNGWASDQVLVWIDWNQNIEFEAGELVFASTVGTGPFTGSVTVPLTALAGTTRMRVRLHDTYTGVDYANTPNDTPCGNSTYGQVEDYTIDMIGIITGAEELGDAAFGVFPNPTDGDLVVRTGSLHGSVLIEVLDAVGRVAYAEQRSVASGSNVQLNLAGRLASGTYVLRMSSNDARAEQRIVIR